MQNGRTPLIWATLRDHVAVATLLLDRGADIEAKDSVSLGQRGGTRCCLSKSGQLAFGTPHTEPSWVGHA